MRAPGSGLRAPGLTESETGALRPPPSPEPEAWSPKPGASAGSASVGRVCVRWLAGSVTVCPGVLAGETTEIDENIGGQCHLDLMGAALRARLRRMRTDARRDAAAGAWSASRSKGEVSCPTRRYGPSFRQQDPRIRRAQVEYIASLVPSKVDAVDNLRKLPRESDPHSPRVSNACT